MSDDPNDRAADLSLRRLSDLQGSGGGQSGGRFFYEVDMALKSDGPVSVTPEVSASPAVGLGSTEDVVKAHYCNGTTERVKCRFCGRPFVDAGSDYSRHVRSCRDAAQRELDKKWHEGQQKNAEQKMGREQ